LDFAIIHALLQEVSLMNELSVNASAPGAPLLSICIPTFNREVFLKECLDSLEDSWVESVEIVVSDNASTDGTSAMLEDFARRLPLRWRRNETNLGFDRNLALVVAMAQGQYCWLLGSDDCVTKGALAKVLEQLRKHDPDILHFGYVQADIAMRPLSRSAPRASGTPVRMTPALAPNYLGELPNVSLLFAFISSFVFRRERWLSQIDQLPQWFDSHYVHAYMMHAMLAAGVTLLSSDDCFVMARGGNPNEFNATPGRMLALDAVTLQRIHREILFDTEHLQALGRVFRRSYGMNTLVSVASQGGMPRLLQCYSALTALGQSRCLLRSLQLATWAGLMPLVRRLIMFRHRSLSAFSARQSHSSK
jgi:abequosyltransferase